MEYLKCMETFKH